MSGYQTRLHDLELYWSYILDLELYYIRVILHFFFLVFTYVAKCVLCFLPMSFLVVAKPGLSNIASPAGSKRRASRAVCASWGCGSASMT